VGCRPPVSSCGMPATGFLLWDAGHRIDDAVSAGSGGAARWRRRLRGAGRHPAEASGAGGGARLPAGMPVSREVGRRVRADRAA
jgi:hypothetical protein